MAGHESPRFKCNSYDLILLSRVRSIEFGELPRTSLVSTPRRRKRNGAWIRSASSRMRSGFHRQAISERIDPACSLQDPQRSSYLSFGLLLFRCILSTDFGTSMPSMSAEESIPSLDGGKHRTGRGARAGGVALHGCAAYAQVSYVMSEESVFWLNSISVVVTARFHNPSILNRDFLVSQEIVPASWTVAEAISTPVVSFVRFRNGIQLSVDEGRLNVVEECKSCFKDKYLVHTVVNDYLKKLPYVPYRSLGLNCSVAMRQEDPEWLMRRFLKQGAWFRGKPMVRSMVPKFATKAGDAECFFTFSHGQALIGQNETGNAVLADCNVHHAGPLDAGSQQEAIGRWAERQKFVIEALDLFLRSPQT